MNREATPIQSRLATVLALVATTALLAAPFCAPLCAGKICASKMSSSDSPHEFCHEMANMPANAPDQYVVATNKSCGAPDSSAALVTADEQSLLLQALRSNSTPALTDQSPAPTFQSVHASPGRWRVHRIPLKSKDFLPLSTILRI